MSSRLFAAALISTVAAFGADWPMPGGNPQHTNWAGSERLIKKTDLKSLKLLYTFHGSGPDPSAPTIVGNLITYKGFKEMLLFQDGSGAAFSVDADLNQIVWRHQLTMSNTCPNVRPAPIVSLGSSSGTFRFSSLAKAAARAGTSYNPYLPALEQSLYPLTSKTLSMLNALYTLSPDGMLHILNSSTGEDLLPAIAFVPAGSQVTELAVLDNVAYAIASPQCGRKPKSLYALDILNASKTVQQFAEGGSFSIAEDKTIYVAASRPKESLVALAPGTLARRGAWQIGKHKGAPQVTPSTFPWFGRDIAIAATRDGKILLLDAKSPNAPLFQTLKLTKRAMRFDGQFATWLDVETGIRRIYVSARAKRKSLLYAFDVTGPAEKPELQKVWETENVSGPAVVADAMVFVSCAGSMRVLDAVTGKELSAFPLPAGASADFAVANGRIYFSGAGGAVYCFGIPEQQSQLFTK